MAKRGPKEKPIDWEHADKLCLIQCTLDEIAMFFNVSPDTIERRCERENGMKYAEYHKRKSVGGKISLRRAMFRKAIDGDNATMQIWLSKQYLGMKDQLDTTINDDSRSKPTVINVNVEELTRIAQQTDLPIAQNASRQTATGGHCYQPSYSS